MTSYILTMVLAYTAYASPIQRVDVALPTNDVETCRQMAASIRAQAEREDGRVLVEYCVAQTK